MSIFQFDRNLRQVAGQNPSIINNRANVPDNFRVDLKDDKPVTANTLLLKGDNVLDRMYCVHRHIESAYLDLPWPDKVHNIVVYTHVVGGYGDIAACAKLISLIKKIKANITIEWILKNYNSEKDISIKEFANNFLLRNDVFIRAANEKPKMKSADMLILGPACNEDEWRVIKDKILTKEIEITGPIFEFREIGDYKPVVNRLSLTKTSDINQDFASIYSTIFPHQTQARFGVRLLMGIRPGCGVFLDSSRLSTPLANVHSCPSYLSNLLDKDLAFDIFSSVDEERFNPENNSFNFAYSDMINARRNFIDCIVIAETSKNVILVMNQKDCGRDFSDEQLISDVFSGKRISFLEELGFSDVFLKTGSGDHIIKEGRGSGRKFTVITRDKFSASDFKNLQLAAERILATGDNSAI